MVCAKGTRFAAIRTIVPCHDAYYNTAFERKVKGFFKTFFSKGVEVQKSNANG